MHTLQTGHEIHEIHERLLLATSASGTNRTRAKFVRSAVSEKQTAAPC